MQAGTATTPRGTSPSPTALAPSAVYAKTRVWGSEPRLDPVTGVWSATSCGTSSGFDCTCGELASDVPEGFLYDGQLRPVAWLDGTGAVKATFVYGLHLNVPEYMTTGKNYRIIHDHLGSPRLVVDSTSGWPGRGAHRLRQLRERAPGHQPGLPAVRLCGRLDALLPDFDRL
jgi:hypothetical protein